jgi:hypothetical protein
MFFANYYTLLSNKNYFFQSIKNNFKKLFLEIYATNNYESLLEKYFFFNINV